MRPDAVTPETAAYVGYRDAYRCVAPSVDGRAGYCHDQWGNVILHWPNRLDTRLVTIAHVKSEGAQAMGKRAPSDAGHLVILCWGHHEGNGEQNGGSCWGTKRENLQRLRRYLIQFSDHHPRTAFRRVS